MSPIGYRPGQWAIPPPKISNSPPTPTKEGAPPDPPRPLGALDHPGDSSPYFTITIPRVTDRPAASMR